MSDFYGQKYYAQFCDKLGQSVELRILQRDWNGSPDTNDYPFDWISEYLFSNNIYDSSLIYPLTVDDVSAFIQSPPYVDTSAWHLPQGGLLMEYVFDTSYNGTLIDSSGNYNLTNTIEDTSARTPIYGTGDTSLGNYLNVGGRTEPLVGEYNWDFENDLGGTVPSNAGVGLSVYVGPAARYSSEHTEDVSALNGPKAVVDISYDPSSKWVTTDPVSTTILFNFEAALTDIVSDNHWWTISFWVQPSSWNPSTAPVFRYRNTFVGINPTTGYFTFYRAGDSFGISADMPNESWANVIMWYDGTNLNAELKGAETGGSGNVLSSGSEDSGSRFFVGGYNDGATDFAFQGRIDSFRVFDRVLDAGERAILFNSYNPIGKGPTYPTEYEWKNTDASLMDIDASILALSFWYKDNFDDVDAGLNFGTGAAIQALRIGVEFTDDGSINFYQRQQAWSSGENATANWPYVTKRYDSSVNRYDGMHHYFLQSADGSCSFYIDGSIVDSFSGDIATNNDHPAFPVSPYVWEDSMKVSLVTPYVDSEYDLNNIRVYNRLLDQEEINYLYSEYDTSTFTRYITPDPSYIGEVDGSAVVYSFDGPQDVEGYLYGSASSESFFDFSAPDEFVISTWFKTDDVSLNVVKKTNDKINLWVDTSGYLNGRVIGIGGDTYNVITPSLVNDDTWRHSVLTFENHAFGAALHLYIDGSLADTHDIFSGNVLTSDSSAITIGDSLKGINMARLRIYPYYMGDASVLTLYEEISPSVVGSTHFWSLDNNLLDSSTNPINLEVSIGTETYVKDGDKTAFNFDGSTVLTADGNVGEAFTGGVYSIWIKTTDTSSVILYNGEGLDIADKAAEMVIDDAGKIVFKVSYNLTAFEDSVTSTNSVNDGEWHQISGYYDVNNPIYEMGLFIDGGFDISTGGAATQSRTDNGPLHIGSDPSGNGLYTGYVDNVRIYGSILEWVKYLALYTSPVTPETLKLLDPGIVLDIPNRDAFEPIRGAGVKIFVKEPSLLYYEDLFNTSPHDNKVIISVDGSVRFQGFVAPEVYENAYNSPFNLAMVIPANDGLGNLENYVQSFQEDNFTTLIKVIAKLLEDTGLQQDIWINSRLFPENVVSDASNWNLFDFTLLEKYAFLRSNEDTFDSRKLLSNILKPFSALIYQEDDHWKIDRNQDIFYSDTSTATQTVQRYDYLGDPLLPYPVNWITTEKGLITLNKVLDGTQSLQKISGHKRVKLNYDSIKYSNIVDLTSINDASTENAAGAENTPILWEWEYNDSLSDVERQANGTVRFTVDTGTWQNFDGLTTLARFSFDPDSVDGVNDTADSIDITFGAQGQYFAVFSDPNNRQSAAVELKIFNTLYPSGYWITQDSSGDFQYSASRADVSIGFDYDTNGAYLTNWAIHDYSFNINLYHLEDYLDSSANDLRITFQPMKNTAGEEHAWSYFRDIKVIMDFNDSQANILNADVDNDFISLYEDDIYYSDITNLNYYNGFETSTGRTTGWYDQDPSIFQLQSKFILDRLALYNSPRYTYIVEMKDASLRTVGDIYYDTLLGEKLAPLGLKYNFRDNVIKLNMIQYATPEQIDVSLGGKRIITSNEWNQNYKDSR